MKNRRVFLAIAAALALLAAWMVFHHGPTTTDPTFAEDQRHVSATHGTTVAAQPTAAAQPVTAAAVNGDIPRTGAAVAAGRKPRAAPRVIDAPSASPTPLDPQSEVGKVRRMISDYHTLMGENPVGTNAEIMRALMGANSHQAILGPPEGQSLNDRGELVDPWGTPYFFHQLSRDVMEIHSAGPDKVMGTADDVVTR